MFLTKVITIAVINASLDSAASNPLLKQSPLISRTSVRLVRQKLLVSSSNASWWAKMHSRIWQLLAIGKCKSKEVLAAGGLTYIVLG
jgi:hypothetical protein